MEYDKENAVKLYKRGFLNTSSEGMAAFEAKVEEDRNYVNGSFAITDCSRKVVLDFDCWDTPDMQNAKDKLRTLITELQSFEEKLHESIEKVEVRKAEKAARKKAEAEEAEHSDNDD